MNILCKVFKFVLGLFKAVVRFVAEAIKVVATAAIDVLDTVVSGVSKAILGNTPLLVIAGVAAFLIFGKAKDKSAINVIATPNSATKENRA